MAKWKSTRYPSRPCDTFHSPPARYLLASASGEVADAFMPLFLILVYPGQVAEFLNVDRKPDAQARAMAYDVFRALDQLAPATCACAVDPERETPFPGLYPTAKDFLGGCRIRLELHVRSGQESRVMPFPLHPAGGYGTECSHSLVELAFSLADPSGRPILTTRQDGLTHKSQRTPDV